MTSNSYIFKDGYYTKIPQPRSVNYSLVQPDYQNNYDCTAAIIDTNQDYFPWITIPCHEKRQASYFCQPIKSSVNIPGAVESNVKCDRDWLLLLGSENCLLVLDSRGSKISFYDSQDVCSLHNASIFKVNISERSRPNVAQENIKDLKSHLLYGMSPSGKSMFYHTYPNISSASIKNMLFGSRLNRDSLQLFLPFYLQYAYMATYDPAGYMSYFTESNHTCSIVEYSKIGDIYSDISYMADGWGVKCRPCSERIKVSGIICEKPAYINVRKCETKHFECHDKTCILSIYQCDRNPDCFDHSDESGCVYNTSSTLINQFVKLPCPPNSDCQKDMGKQVRVHDVCDGIYSDDTFLLEKDVCVDNSRRVIMAIARSHKVRIMKSNTFTSAELVNIFWQEYRYKCKKFSSLYTFELNHTSTYNRLFEGKLLKQNTKLNDMCLFRERRYSCKSISCTFMCMVIACPGMFKCHDYVCVPLSYYCDGINHCTLGEDEILCYTFTPVCPGYLKCRGERKCISTDELCDKNINCFYSMDDELGCDTCPVNCECGGYVMSCHSNNDDQIIKSGVVVYAKGLLIKGTQQVLTANNLEFIGLLFLNISYCKLEKVDVSYGNETRVFLIVADFSRNQLTITTFLTSRIFHRTVFLDLSFNLLHTFKYGRSLSLTYLSVLYLTGNNLKEITMTIRDSHLAYINLQFINYSPDIAVRIDHNVNLDIMVAVTDSQLCCVFSVHVKCLSNQNDFICYGILNYLSAKATFYCLSVLSMFLSLIVSIKQAFNILSRDKKSQNKKYYSVLLMNQSLNNILSSLYLVSIFSMDIIKIELFVFKTSISCALLNAVLYVSLESIIIFKSSVSLLIALKIRFPFRHQCPWLKWVTLASGCVWLFIITTYMMHFFLPFSENSSHHIFDKLCSIAWCEMYINFNLLLGMIYFVDQLSICIYIFAFLLTYFSLKNYQNKFRCETSSNTYSAGGVTCKCILANILEIILRIYLATLLSVKLIHVRYVHLCFSFFLYALPTNILFSCFIHLFQ